MMNLEGCGKKPRGVF